MSKPADHETAAPVASFITRLQEWWRYHNELGNLPREELEHMAGELGMTGRDLEDLAGKGPHAADLVYQRMGALGLSRSDVERIGHGLMGDLEKTCACCNEKSQCKKDLAAARPGNVAWKDYCPNAISLESIEKTKSRHPV
jgi:hypothetical protein